VVTARSRATKASGGHCRQCDRDDILHMSPRSNLRACRNVRTTLSGVYFKQFGAKVYKSGRLQPIKGGTFASLLLICTLKDSLFDILMQGAASGEAEGHQPRSYLRVEVIYRGAHSISGTLTLIWNITELRSSGVDFCLRATGCTFRIEGVRQPKMRSGPAGLPTQSRI